MMASITASNECLICCESYNKKNKKISCEYCDFNGCQKCLKTCIKMQESEPACPECKHCWSIEFCNKYLTKKFMNNEYKEKIMEKMFHMEKQKIADSMQDTKNMIEADELKELIKKENNELRKARELLERKKEKINKMKKKEKDLRQPNYKESGFKNKCPVEHCNGFLDENWTCFLCHSQICQHCMENLSLNDKEHVCDPDVVASCEMIKNQSKPCPGCSEMISKINGCDQMWCTKCHIAFDWNTGNIDYGNVHNPHFIEWKKNNGEQLFHLPGEIMCGGLLDIKYYTNYKKSYKKINSKYSGLDFHKITNSTVSLNITMNLPIFTNTINQYRFFHWLEEINSAISSFRRFHLDNYRALMLNQDITREVRIEYIRKQISDKTFKKKIYKLNMKRKRQIELLHIFELLYVVHVERMNEIQHILNTLMDDECLKYRNDYYKSRELKYGYEQTYQVYINYRANMHLKYCEKITKIIDDIENITYYCNKEIYKIGKKYNLSKIPLLVDNLQFIHMDISYTLVKDDVIQKTQRRPFVHNRDWNEDVIPVKDLFYDNKFENKVIFNDDGTYKEVSKNEEYVPDDDEAIVSIVV